jgi:enoyl-CoA hydratase
MDTPNSDAVLFSVDQQIATITLNRPKNRNALSVAANQRLLQLWDEVDRDDAIRVVVLTSADCGVFCAGMDLKEAAQIRATIGKDILDVLVDPFYERMRRVTKPVIAAMTGDFTAAGMVLAMNSDLRVGLAGTHAGIAEARFGRGTAWAIPLLWMLPQAVLLEMIYTAEFMSIERLHAFGFVNYIEPTPDAVREKAFELARQILRNAPLSIVAAKAGLMSGIALGEKEGTAVSKQIHKKVYESEDAQEGPRAFAAKRLPQWQNR